VSLTPAEWHRRYTEQARWTADLRRYLLMQVRLSPQARLLEVGCGTGAVLSEIKTPSASELRSLAEGVYGIDMALPSLRLARQHVPGAALACADAHRLPFADASFDLVLAHFLLLWVKDPLRVLNEMRRVARPGGAVMALAEPDYGGRVDYPAALAQVGAWQAASLQAQGADPNAGRKLAGWLCAAGLAEVQAGVLGGQWQAQRLDPAALDSEWQVISADLQALPGASIPAAETARLRRLDEAARREGERVLFVPTFYAWGKAR
jgi:SAM-dependent methyltransferase